MFPGLTDSAVIGLVTEILRSVEPAAEERSLGDRVLVVGNSGGRKNAETEDGDSGGDALSGDVHCW